LRRRAGSVQATLDNAQSNLLYLVNVTVGTPTQNFALQLDTGSSDIWIPAADSDVCQESNRCSNGAFDPNSSSSFGELAQGAFDISYVDGTKIQGDYISETFGIGGAKIENQTMGLANDARLTDDSSPFQGIIGVGFPSGESIASADPSQVYPNIINMLKDQGHTSTLAYSLWLNDLEASTGSILFGGVDNSKFKGDLVVLPIQPDSESGGLTSFTVVLDNVNVEAGNGKVQYSQNSLAMPVILDSGTTLTYLPDDMANDIMTGVGAVNSEEAGVFVPCDLMNSPATFNFGFGSSAGPKIQVQISEFVVPYPPFSDGSYPTLNDGTPICQWGILPAGDTPNLFGDTFLRSAYVVYDLQNKNIGLAQTVFNATGSDVKDITGSSLPGATSTASGTVVTQTFSGHP
ncbi:acid protease, partial [Rhizodiscina lignyota]